MEIRRLDWRPANIAKLLAHGITRDEVQEIVDRDAWVSTVRPAYPNQARIIGPTHEGRMLTIVLEEMGDATVWRPVTGWRSSDEELAYYLDEAHKMRYGQ